VDEQPVFAAVAQPDLEQFVGKALADLGRSAPIKVG
jgi:hypothetical protein